MQEKLEGITYSKGGTKSVWCSIRWVGIGVVALITLGMLQREVVTSSPYRLMTYLNNNIPEIPLDAKDDFIESTGGEE